MSRAIITIRRTVATITPSVLVVRRAFNVALSATAAFVAAAVKGAATSAALQANTSLAAVVVALKATAAALQANVSVQAVAVKTAFTSAALGAIVTVRGLRTQRVTSAGDVRTTSGGHVRVIYTATAPAVTRAVAAVFVVNSTIAVSRRAVSQQRATSAADRRVTSDGNVRVTYSYA